MLLRISAPPRAGSKMRPTTPELRVFMFLSSSLTLCPFSGNSRFPLPRINGCTQIWYSSIRSCCIRVCISVVLPYILNVPAGRLLQRRDFLRDIALDECGVPLQWLLELLRRYELRNCVHAFEIWPLLDLAPRSRKKLVGDASGEEIVALH